MTNKEAIKFLQQLYPNGGHCWLDEQRIEAIGMAVKALQEEPVAPKVLKDILNAKTAAESLGISQEEHDRIVDELIYGKEPELVDVDDLPEEEPVSEDLKTELNKYIKDYFTIDTEQLDRFGIEEKDYIYSMDKSDMLALAEHFTNWQKSNLWKPADGEDLPEYDREVIALIKYNAQHNIHDEEYPTYRVGFGHRPDPKGWDGKSVTTGQVEHYTPKTYDKGDWNIPDIVYWLDVELPKEIEL
ncbi:hypothetical protein SAMN04487851_11422 [Prevotella sp. tc2-28]|uniref:hypothetical protein n=1 Tax=Prevotella sp. tc2-28 TaxID=1761888 RepID=UPI00089C1176|nr:hypothetical protein [Prevotella sp. tc2-28]SEA78775.1 hypothetical protein SAMN04487851_11422 [Prevotella sp. tc2-28]